MNFVTYLLMCVWDAFSVAYASDHTGSANPWIGILVIFIAVIIYIGASFALDETRLSHRLVPWVAVLVLIAVFVVFTLISIIIEQGIMGIAV